MKTDILLGKAKYKLGTNEDNFIDVKLSSIERKLSETEETYAIDFYKQYFYEKDNSQKYRLAFTITPYCTNVLFNVITEPVYKEGSEDSVLINRSETGKSINDELFKKYQQYKYGNTGKTLNLKESIDDTAYSLEGVCGLKYHCGYDIFNNHYLRNLGFVEINKLIEKNEYFNSIRDTFRDNSGNTILKESLIANFNCELLKEKRPVNIYKNATLDEYFTAVDKNLTEENGWFGFINKSIVPVNNYSGSTIDKNVKWYVINKCMNDYEAGDFVDMYPDRTLFSFEPKYNEFRKRVESNWDYCITYPSEKINDNYLIKSAEFDIEGIKTKVENCNIFFAGETPNYVVFKTLINHNLKAGDFVTISFVSNNDVLKKTKQVRVYEVGNNGEDISHWFSVRTAEIYNEIYTALNLGGLQKVPPKEVRVRKCENGVECEYYLRKFKKIDIESSSLNKLAFSQNSYSDQVAQIVFTEDIKTNGLTDYLKRPLSELYLTIIKRNKGHEKWYENDIYNTYDIEYSHCFGKVTSGFDLSDDNECEDFNIHRIHNVHGKNGIPEPPESLENDITIDEDEFYGDIVEFSPSRFDETSLEPVYHRFNTAQRETTNENFADFSYTEIGADSYDAIGTTRFVDSSITDYINSLNIKDEEGNSSPNITNINIIPEGYYYKAHYPVKIREFKEEVSEGYHIELTYTSETIDEHTIILNLDKNYYFQSNDTVYLYCKNENGYYEYITSGYCSSTQTELSNNFKIVKITFDSGVSIDDSCKIFRHNTEMPEYAYEIKDGTGRYVWRELMSFEEMPTDSELYNSQFTNGAHYHHKNISFYLKRQDPDGVYGIGKLPLKMNMFLIESEKKNVQNYEYKNDFDTVKC